jgi:hypothetical protein
MISEGISFKKRVLKKIKFEKGVPIGKNSENGPPVRSMGGRRGAGDLPPIQRAGGSKTRASSRIPEVPYFFVIFIGIYILQTI